MSQIRIFAFLICLFSSVLAVATNFTCDVCGMTVPNRTEIVLKDPTPGAKALHVCSLSCFRKARKLKEYFSADVANFNHPDKLLPADNAYFLIKSEKIKPDLGELAMPPYFGAFATKKDADAAQVRYGYGQVVQGLNEAIK